MKFPAEYRLARALRNALSLGLATAAVFSVVLALSPFLAPSEDTQSAKSAVQAIAQTGSIFIVRQAMAAVPALPEQAKAPSAVKATAQAGSISIVRQATAAVSPVASPLKPATDIMGGDSRAEDYRLERDSCCIGN